MATRTQGFLLASFLLVLGIFLVLRAFSWAFRGSSELLGLGLSDDDNFSKDYQRDRLSDWIIQALENAGRHEEIIPICEQEAVKSGSYPRLVDALRKAKRYQEAEQWIFKGVRAIGKKWPGIAKQLKDTLREMTEREGDWLKVAAFRTEDFLQSPSLHTFQDMKKAAEKAKAWPEVRAAALLYLEIGKLPQTDPTWPVPETGVREDRETMTSEFPMIDVLIDIAIEEKRPDEVLRWYRNISQIPASISQRATSAFSHLTRNCSLPSAGVQKIPGSPPEGVRVETY